MDTLYEVDILIQEQLNLVSAYRNAVLMQAVQGKLVEQDPNDEPAAELLKRIREEKERLTKEKKIKKEKPLPPISPEEIPYELPKGWEWVRLGEITSVQGGKRVPKGYTLLDEPTDHVYIRVSDMKNGTIMTNDLKYISDEVYETIKDYTISKDDLYITIAGTIGQVGTVPDELDGMNLTENAAKIIVVLANKHYLKYVLRSNLLQQQFIDKVNQVAQPKLALKRIKMAVIPLPPIDEQLRIVNKIEEMLYAVELLEMNYVDEAQEFKRLMQVMLAEAFQNRYS
jgi:type I restriction enzyme S subunit